MSDKLTPEEMAAALELAGRTVKVADACIKCCPTEESDPWLLIAGKLARALRQLDDEREVVPLSIEKDGYRVDTVEFAQVVTLLDGNIIIGRTRYRETDEKWEAFLGDENPDYCCTPLGRYDTPAEAADAIYTTWEAEQDAE